MKTYLSTAIAMVMAFQFTAMAQTSTQKSETRVQITTDFGNIIVKLYNDTPKHRDNFVKLVKGGWYNGSPFHRVIAGFMIQGGGNDDGRQDPGYTIDAEILPKYYHKKGALAAARQGDQVNPQKKSSGSQFYIVQGSIYSNENLNGFEQRYGKKYTEEQRKAYTTVGGAPHLDGAYTVFGEVVSGLDVVDKIAAVQRDAGDKPLKPVKMTMKILEY